jgi:calcineurin-like phosphoesterase family protein
MRWWTSDLHLGHQNIIRYCARPFASVEAMDDGLIDRWNQVVDPADEVWLLGDVAMGGVAAHLPLVKLLAGRKILVPGNHDACWSGRSKDVERWTEAYLEAGFAEVVQGPVAAEVAGREVLVDHFPYRGDSKEQDRFLEHRPVDQGRWILHGHVHERWLQAGRQINVGVDAWGGRPAAEHEVGALIARGPADRPARPWDS